MDSGQTKCNCCSNITDERSLRSLFLLLLTEKVLVLILLSCIFKTNMQDFFVYFYNISQTGRGIYQFDYAEATNRK